MASDDTTRLDQPLSAGVLLQVLDGIRGDYLGMAEYNQEQAYATSSDMYRAQYDRAERESRLVARLVAEIARDLRDALSIEQD